MIKGFELSLFDIFVLLEFVNIIVDKISGIDLIYYWEFSDGEKSMMFFLFVIYNFMSIGEVDIFVFVINDVSLVVFWCLVDV